MIYRCSNTSDCTCIHVLSAGRSNTPYLTWQVPRDRPRRCLQRAVPPPRLPARGNTPPPRHRPSPPASRPAGGAAGARSPDPTPACLCPRCVAHSIPAFTLKPEIIPSVFPCRRRAWLLPPYSGSNSTSVRRYIGTGVLRIDVFHRTQSSQSGSSRSVTRSSGAAGLGSSSADVLPADSQHGAPGGHRPLPGGHPGLHFWDRAPEVRRPRGGKRLPDVRHRLSVRCVSDFAQFELPAGRVHDE